MLDTNPTKAPPPLPYEMVERVLMRNHGLDIAGLVEATGIDVDTFSKLAKGEAKFTPDVAERFRPRFGQVADSLVKLQFGHDFYAEHGRLATEEDRKAA